MGIERCYSVCKGLVGGYCGYRMESDDGGDELFKWIR